MGTAAGANALTGSVRVIKAIVVAALMATATSSAALAEVGRDDTRGYSPIVNVATPITTTARETIKVTRGDTLMAVLTEASIPRAEAHGAIQALRDVYDPRRLRAGHQVTVLFEEGADGARRFFGFEISPDSRRSFKVARADDNGFASSRQEITGTRRTSAFQGEIRSSLFGAGAAQGVPRAALVAFMNAFAHEVDFQRDIQPGDRFELLFDHEVGPDGRTLAMGELRYAALMLSGERHALYRYEGGLGGRDFFNEKGESVRQALLMTPIDGARLTSGFGMRRHPILGYGKMHKGVDFGAPSGTPIYAAGDGVVVEAGRKSGYGNYIRIRHGGDIATAYAHMSRFARGMGRGARVDQGEVIGYVGSTGRSTGPHLHYEVHRHGRQINPRSLRMPVGERLAGAALRRFEVARADVDRQFRDALGPAHLVSLPELAPIPARKAAPPIEG